MRWIWLAVSIVSGTVGDLLSAKGMVEHGHIKDFGPREVSRLLRYMVTHPLLLAGIVSNAVSFFSFLALLSVAELSFAVPASASAYILKTALAGWYLDERVTWRRWMGAVFISIGVCLLAL